MHIPFPRINSERLWTTLMHLATIGATPAGGVCRLALTEEDRQAGHAGSTPMAGRRDALWGAARIVQAAQEEGHSHRDMVSGAAHDAIAIARVAPTAMIFVPCAGGISHDESESATPEDLAAGAQVLLRSVLKVCEVASA